MASISQMTGAARSIYSSLYSSSSRTDATAALFGGNTQRGGGTSLFSAQYRAQDSSAQELRSVLSIANEAASLRKSYAETSSKFYAEYDADMRDLRKSAGAVKTMSYDLDSTDIKSNADGSKTYSDRLKKAIGNVKDLVAQYNETNSFLAGSKDIGPGVRRLASEFSDTTYKADSYAKMGITVNAKTGQMQVNESRLARALTTSPAQSEAILGRDGLAGRADRHAEFAQMSRNRVFPSMQQSIGKQLRYADGMLTGGALPSMSRYSNMLNLFSIYV